MSDTGFVTGSLKWFDPEKGYGFAVYQGKDIFIHSKRLRESGFEISKDPKNPSFAEGDPLKFKIETGPKGDYAVQISKA
jgi:CspA family cold shock protein